MRKGRIVFWVISLVICAIIIVMYKEEESKIPQEDKTPINVCCVEEFQNDIKSIIEGSSIGETHRVVFSENKDNSEVILTDKISATDEEYEKIGWSPLIVVFDNTTEDKVESYKEGEYLISNHSSYVINFDKIIEDTISGKWKDKIYCPKSNTREGELFFDFLLINVNDGIYPESTEELEQCTEKANKFLNSNIVIQADATERLKNKKTVENELYIIFERDMYSIDKEIYSFQISYPSNTVIYELYLKVDGENANELKEELFDDGIFSYCFLDTMNKNKIRYEGTSYYDFSCVSESKGFSYVEIPLKEE